VARDLGLGESVVGRWVKLERDRRQAAEQGRPDPREMEAEITALRRRVRELEQIRNFLTGQALTSVLDLLFSFIFIAVMWFYSGWLTLIVLVSLPVYAAWSALITPVLRARLNEKFARYADNQSFLVESVTALGMAALLPNRSLSTNVRADALEVRADGEPTGHVVPVLNHGDAEPGHRQCQLHPARARRLRSGFLDLVGLLDARPRTSGGGARPACRRRPRPSPAGPRRTGCPGRDRRTGRPRTHRGGR